MTIDFGWVPLLTAACSVWLFHYGRSGLRAICAPVFLLVFTLLLDRVERRPDRIAGLACGGVLGVGIYGYTACRTMPIAFAVYAAFRLLQGRDNRISLIKPYSLIASGAVLVSIRISCSC